MIVEKEVTAWLVEQEVPAFLVGGCLRDRLLGRPVYDLDVAVDGDGLVLARRLANHFGGAYYPLDERRGTGRAILQTEGGQRLVVDIARLRGPDLAADLADRDFTVNALAADVGAPEEVIDQHNGLADLSAGLIRPVSEASIRHDPLRALRAVRLGAVLGFSLAAETQALIRRDGSALATVAGERVRDELARLLLRPQAASWLECLDEMRLLTTIIDELEPLRSLAQPAPHHLDVLAHSLETVRTLETLLSALPVDEGPRTRAGEQGAEPESLSPASCVEVLARFSDRLRVHSGQVLSDARPRLVTLKLAALLHDTGKAGARTVDQTGRIRFIGHQKEGAKIAGGVLRRLRFSNAEVRVAEAIILHHMRPLLLAKQKHVSSRAVYRFFRDTRTAGVDVLLHALADHQATYAPNAQDDRLPGLVALTERMLADYWERRPERVDPPPLVDGNYLLHELGLQPGPDIGRLLEAVREAQVSGEVRSREDALALVQKNLVDQG